MWYTESSREKNKMRFTRKSFGSMLDKSFAFPFTTGSLGYKENKDEARARFQGKQKAILVLHEQFVTLNAKFTKANVIKFIGVELEKHAFDSNNGYAQVAGLGIQANIDYGFYRFMFDLMEELKA
jgi:hypothetical protein